MKTEYSTSPIVAPVRGTWTEEYQIDPITQLIGFPDFHRCFPALFQKHLTEHGNVGIAIGDVDDMKHYVESTKTKHPWLFGHLAGNALMSNLGKCSLDWLQKWHAPWAALSSFGGDEVILVATGLERSEFASSVRSLCNILSEELPCSVSFAYGWFTRSEKSPMDMSPFFQHYATALTQVDRALFRSKMRRNNSNGIGPHVVWLITRCLTTNGWVMDRADVSYE